MTNSHRKLGVLGTAGVVAAFVAATAGAAFGRTAFHTRLVKSEPGKDSTVSHAPESIKLFFSEEVKPAVAGVKLLASDSSVIATGALTSAPGAPAVVVAPVKGAMKPGVYRVMWRVAGEDGHPTTGDFTFTVKAAAPKTP